MPVRAVEEAGIMAEMMRCRSCGYLIPAGKLGDACPACGVPRKMFEAWSDPVSEKRRQLLGFDIHPIIVHFSISFSTSAFLLALFVLVFPQVFRQTATGILRGFVGSLPVFVLGSFVSGLFDGKIRFRRTTTPLLSRKKLLALGFFVTSTAAAVLTFAVSPFETWVRVVDVVLLFCGVAFAVALGRLGRGLLHALFPG